MKKFDNYVSNLRVLSTAKYEDLQNEFIVSGIIDKLLKRRIKYMIIWMKKYGCRCFVREMI